MPMDEDPLWYKDAIIYELHVKAFFDGNGDGVGDFPGLISKLDYLQELGVNTLWLLPFYPSPMRDDGYDIADYTQVHPTYGTLHDFKVLLEEANYRGIHIITELVLNHTSDRHAWFQRARRAPHRRFALCRGRQLNRWPGPFPLGEGQGAERGRIGEAQGGRVARHAEDALRRQHHGRRPERLRRIVAAPAGVLAAAKFHLMQSAGGAGEALPADRFRLPLPAREDLVEVAGFAADRKMGIV